MTLNNDNRFDIDLQYGQVREQELADILQNEKIEVKTERDKWKETGNICIEFQCRGQASGIAVTEAKWWVHVLADGDEADDVRKRLNVFTKTRSALINALIGDKK